MVDKKTHCAKRSTKTSTSDTFPSSFKILLSFSVLSSYLNCKLHNYSKRELELQNMCQLCTYSPKKVIFLLFRGERIYLTFQWDMIRKRLHSPPCRKSHSPGSTGVSPSRCGGPRTKLAAERSWRDASFHVSVWHPGSGSAVRQRSLWPCTSCPPG